MFSGYSCILAFVHMCFPNVSNTYLEEYWNYFHQTFSMVYFGTEMSASSFGIGRSKFVVTIGSHMLENALFGLVSAIC